MAMNEPTRYGKFLLLEKLATGGMAQLYRAKLVGLEGFEKIIAIKQILPHLSTEKGLVDAFIDEAKLAALLNHQNIVQIYDFGKIEDSYFISMEYLFGKDLRGIAAKARERGMPLGLENTLYIASRICAGLDYAHKLSDFQGKALNIIHRDISPPNIFITYEGEVKIVDFGIAKAASQSTITQVGMIKGKVAYMSPEQASGNPIDHRSDIFSAGILLYEMLSGKRLFHGDTMQILAKVRRAEFDPPEAAVPGLPIALYEVLHQALAREPRDRYQTSGEMLADLEECVGKLSLRPSADSLGGYMKRLFAEEIVVEGEAMREVAAACPAQPSIAATRAGPPSEPAGIGASRGAVGSAQAVAGFAWRFNFKWLAVLGTLLVLGTTGYIIRPKIVALLAGWTEKRWDASEVQRLVEEALRNKGLDLVVTVSPDRVATLAGTVRDENQLDEAVRLAKLPGVKEVQPNITVAPAPPDSEEIQRVVERRLRENGLSLNVTVSRDGVVTLGGTVANRQQEKEAVALARVLPGAKAVQTRITVVPPSPDSEEIQKVVERRLRENGFKDLKVAISADRVVRLSGTLPDEQQRDEAIRLARLVPDVRAVQPKITVVSPLPAPAAIQQQVERRLRENGFSLRVEVNPNRIVTLAGVVESEDKSDLAKSIAAGISGVTQVKDMIIIAPPIGGPTKIR